MKERAAKNEPIHTWGGREYYCEQPKLVPNKFGSGFKTQTYDYKMINVLIQGSAADYTKEALIRYWDALCEHNSSIQRVEDQIFFMLSVHDEFLGSSPAEQIHTAMEMMRVAMEQPTPDVPMLSEGTTSAIDFGHMVAYDKQGKRL